MANKSTYNNFYLLWMSTSLRSSSAAVAVSLLTSYNASSLKCKPSCFLIYSSVLRIISGYPSSFRSTFLRAPLPLLALRAVFCISGNVIDNAVRFRLHHCHIHTLGNLRSRTGEETGLKNSGQYGAWGVGRLEAVCYVRLVGDAA